MLYIFIFYKLVKEFKTILDLMKIVMVKNSQYFIYIKIIFTIK